VTAFLPLAKAEWGTVPDWVTAFGTLAAFAVALRLLAKELDARREYQQDRQRYQASRVACWFILVEVQRSRRRRDVPIMDYDTPEAFTPYKVDVPAAVLHNGSEEPVFDCQVHVELDRASKRSLPGGQRQLTFTEHMVPPGQTKHELGLNGSDLSDLSAWMVFTDANNQRWQRSRTGRLSRLVKSSTQLRRSRKDYMNAWIAGELDHLDY
jgi:hypothetical protein